MPRPSVNLDPYQEEITRLVNSNYTNEDIYAFLLNTYSISTSAKLLILYVGGEIYRVFVLHGLTSLRALLTRLVVIR